jgi:hypothetical protein
MLYHAVPHYNTFNNCGCVIVLDERHQLSSLTTDIIHLLGIKESDFIEAQKSYNLTLHPINNSIKMVSFINDQDASDFIDNFLNPYIIMYNLTADMHTTPLF